MQMNYNLRLETNQKLTMTPQLCQAITILQLSSLELAAMVENEILENPVLEVGENHGGEEPGVNQGLEESDAGKIDRNEKINYDEWSDYLSNENNLNKMKDLSFDQTKNLPDLFTAYPVSLHEHLEMQLHLSMPEMDGFAERIGKFLIGSIDDNGYLTTTVEEAAAVLKAPEFLVADVLSHIQTFDPAGVGARNVRECLEIQLSQTRCCSSWELYYIVKGIIEKYLEQIGAGKLRYVAEKLSCTVQEVQQAIDVIRKLEPKPGRIFSRSEPTYLQPDVIIERGHDGNYLVNINDKNVPSLSISSYYRQIIKNTAVGTDAKKFVEERLNSAVWLIKSIEQRRQTLINVTEAIVDLQREFFDNGTKFLRPLVMKQVADRVNVHESTISRTVANKYAATPHGLFPMNSFFSAGIQGINGEFVAASRIKREILELVSNENTKNPLSDMELSDILSQSGVTVSRRTVTKYRKELEIPASFKRKRY